MNGHSSILAIILTVIVVLTLGRAQTCLAHAYGSGGVGQYIRLFPGAESVQIELDMHFAEIPSAAMRGKIDLNHDGKLQANEKLAFLGKSTQYYRKQLELQVQGSSAKAFTQLLHHMPEGGIAEHASIRETPGENDRATLRFNWRFTAEIPPSLRRSKTPLQLRLKTLYRPPKCAIRMALHVPEDDRVAVRQSTLPTDRDVPRPPDITPTIKDPTTIPRVHEGLIKLEIAPRLTAAARKREQPVGDTGDDASLLTSGKVVPDAGTANQGAGTDTSRARQVITKNDTTPDASVQSRLETKILSLLSPPFSLGTRIAAIALCVLWGALHAFTPGHGKVIVSTYLIGTSAKYRHAVIIGVLVTVSHTAIVMVLAVAALILQDRFQYPTWLQPLGACVIILVGINQLRLGLLGSLFHGITHAAGHQHAHHEHAAHDHDHDNAHAHHAGKEAHEHAHTHAQATADHAPQAEAEAHSHGLFFKHTHAPSTSVSSVTAKDIGAIGITGGLVPCPAAIIMLLLAWQVKAPALGLACLISFGIGLAATLILVGLLAVSGTSAIIKWVSEKREDEGLEQRLLQTVLPAIGGIVMIVFGGLMLMGA